MHGRGVTSACRMCYVPNTVRGGVTGGPESESVTDDIGATGRREMAGSWVAVRVDSVLIVTGVNHTVL